MIRRTGYLALLFCASLLGSHGQALANCAAPENPIVAENCLSGNASSEWDINGAGDSSIQGYATQISVDRGQTVFFKVKTTAANYKLDIYRLGYYGGMGARKVDTVLPSATLPQSQPNCLSNAATGLIDCGNWAVSASWVVPANSVSGIYFAKLVRNDNGGASHILFVVRDDTSTSDLLFQTSDTTWQAYNSYGGNSLYTGSPAGRAYKVSYNRPFNTRSVDNGQDWLFNAEYPMLRWLEANGYDVSYFTGVDSDRRGNLISDHKALLSVGHDEYWSGGQRANVESARNAGVHLAFFSGNEVFWKTRWENSIDGSGTAYRTLVCYKETHANAVIDPQDPPTWTGTWRDPRFSPPADGGRPENELTGTMFTVNASSSPSDAIKVPEADGKMRFWRNTTVATLMPGAVATLAGGTLGYEWDEELDNGFRPPGLVRLSSTTINGVQLLQDYGSTYAGGTATHRLTLYKHGSGALVFGAGTVQWSWGLDSNHDRGSNPADARMRQATVNLFADMAVQPATLQAGLVTATISTDTIAPSSTISSPTSGSNVPVGSPTTISGTATDAGGGVVGGVEVSVDGGVSWLPANGRGTWSYSWIPSGSGNVTIKSRAADDSGNLQAPGPGVTVTVGSGTPNPCNGSTLWPATAVPTVAAEADTSAVELGVKFRSDVNGTVCGVRFYKGSANTGTHVGKLWSSGGTLLAQATFTGETASGWQQVNFSTPVAITATAVYVASYHAPNGRYAVNEGYFTTGVDTPPLHALQDVASGGNGVYLYGTGGFPTNTFGASNYWVDVVFNTSAGPDTSPPTDPTNLSATAVGTSQINLSWSASTDNVGVSGYRVERCLGAGCSNFLQVATPTGTAFSDNGLASGTTYRYRVRAADAVPNFSGYSNIATATTATSDTTPPTVTSTSPVNGATGVATGTAVTATFSEPLAPATVNTSTFELRNASSALVPATISYNANTATLTPTSPLAGSATYTATVKGGAADPRVKNVAGNALAANHTWSFTTAAGSTGLIGAYSFNEGVGSIAGDASGNSHTGTVTGATWTTSGKYGGTLNFDGTNDHVTIADSAALDLTTGMTLSAWVRPTALSTWRTVLLKERSGGLVYALYASDQASHPNTYINIGGSDFESTGPTALPLNVWNNLATTYDGSALRVYINGVQVSSRPVAGSLLSSTGALRIGGNSVWGEYFQGLIDEVRIYSRVLTAAEIQTDMNTPVGGAPPPPPPPGGSTIGQWSNPVELGMVAVNMVQLHTGKILMYRGENIGGTSASVWDPQTGLLTSAPAPYNVFCSGHSSLADGRILVVGGHDNAGGILGANKSAIFDPVTETWTSMASMAYRRWYPSATTLPDGRVLATSGGTTCFDCYADVPEVYNPQANLWTQLTGAKLAFPYYPFIFVLPDGRILNAGAGELAAPTRVLDLLSQQWTTVDGTLIDGGSAVMYRPGKVLKAGTPATTDVSNAPTAATTHVLDMTAQSPVWRQTASMAFPRAYHTLSVLPDGNVLVTGGGVTTEGKDVSAAVYEAELWSPTTETWQTMAAMQRPRLYHSTALLLPDGRVVVAGSGDSYGGPNQTTAEFYSPPYLFKGNRPVITSAPSQVAYAGGFTVSLVDTSTIMSVALMRPGAVTHQFDEDQRYVSLGFQQSGNTLSVNAPGNGNLAPPGYYMLFVLNSAGVPSVASWIRMLPAT